MEHEVRFYYSMNEYEKIITKLNGLDILENNGRKYEKTSQFNHPSKEYDFYSKDIDGRFRVRITKGNENSSCKISWKRRLENSIETNINKEEEIELSVDINEYNNLIHLLKNVIHMKEVEIYERYRTTFINNEVEIALDEYPFGLALEIEAKNNNNAEIIINKYVNLLNLDYKNSYRLSWDDKYEELCKEQNKDIYKHVLFGKDMPFIKEKMQ